MKIRITAIKDETAQMLNVENMKYGTLPILDIWKRLVHRAFITHETLEFGETARPLFAKSCGLTYLDKHIVIGWDNLVF